MDSIVLLVQQNILGIAAAAVSFIVSWTTVNNKIASLEARQTKNEEYVNDKRQTDLEIATRLGAIEGQLSLIAKVVIKDQK